MDQDEERVPKLTEIEIRVKPEFYLEKARNEHLNGNHCLAYNHYVNYVECLKKPSEEISPLDHLSMTQLALKVGLIFEDDKMDLARCIKNIEKKMKENEEKLKEKEKDKDKEIDHIAVIAQDKDRVIKCYLQTINYFPKNERVLNELALYLYHQGEFEIARKYFIDAAENGYLPAQRNLVTVNRILVPRWHYRLLNDKFRNECFKGAIIKAIRKGYKKIVDIGAGSGLLSMIAYDFQKDVRITAFEENKIYFEMTKNIICENNIRIQFVKGNSTNCTASLKDFNLILTDIFDAALFSGNCLDTIYHAVRKFTTESNYQIIPRGAKLYVTGLQSEKLQNKYRFTKTLKKLKLENICLKVFDYERHDAKFLDTKNVNFLTETENIQIFDFHNTDHLVAGMVWMYADPETVNLKVIKDGILTSLALWYDLYLDDQIKISTSPRDPNNRWEQAIFHLPHPIDVKKGDIIKIKPNNLEYNVLKFDVESPVVNCKKCFYVNKEIISFLNDTKLTETISQVVDHISDCDNDKTVEVLDISEFPLFGFLMCLKGAKVHHVFKNIDDIDFFKHVMDINNISESKFILVSEKTAITSNYLSYVKKWDYFYTGIMRFDTSWNRLCRDMPLIDIMMDLPYSLPQKIFLKTELIQSDYLDFCNKIDDNNVFNFKIGQFMNKYSGDEHPQGLRSLKYKSYSEHVTFDVSDFSTNYWSLETKVAEDGEMNGILFWFEMQYFEGKDIRFSTSNSSHYEKNCMYLSEPKKVKKGQIVKIFVYKVDCYLNIYCN